MLHSQEGRRTSLLQNRLLLLAFTIFILALAAPGSLHAQTVATYNFDDGTADGWVSFYNASTPVASNAAAETGSVQLAHDDELDRAGRAVHSRQRPFSRPERNTPSPAIVMLTNGESRNRCQLHHQAQRSELLRRHMLRHHRHLPGPGVGFGMGADRRKLHRQRPPKPA